MNPPDAAPKPKTMSPQTAYYYRNRDAILAKEKEKKRWLKYYEENKDAISERRKRAPKKASDVG